MARGRRTRQTPRANAGYTVAEVTAVVNLAKQGASDQEIAAKVGRTSQGIMSLKRRLINPDRYGPLTPRDGKTISEPILSSDHFSRLGSFGTVIGGERAQSIFPEIQVVTPEVLEPEVASDVLSAVKEVIKLENLSAETRITVIAAML